MKINRFFLPRFFWSAGLKIFRPEQNLQFFGQFFIFFLRFSFFLAGFSGLNKILTNTKPQYFNTAKGILNYCLFFGFFWWCA